MENVANIDEERMYSMSIIPGLPTLKISSKSFTFNSACMKLLPDVDYIQMYTDFEGGNLFIKESDCNKHDATPWRINCGGREIHSKKVKWPKLYNYICQNMGWSMDDTYTVPASLKSFDDGPAILFHLNMRKSAKGAAIEQEIKRLTKMGLIDIADDGV